MDRSVALRSWVPGADGSGFPAEHLPYGVFGEAGGDDEPAGAARVGARIGDFVVDLGRLAAADLITGPFEEPSLNPFMADGPRHWSEVRSELQTLACDESVRPIVEPALIPVDQVRMHRPFEVGDYVDFYSSIEHASNLGRLFRPDNPDPLLPNWRHLPVGYHGRSGTVVVTGTPIARPSGQRLGAEGQVLFGRSVRLDIELEVGFVVGVGSAPHVAVPIGAAPSHVFGVVLVNDWSARDIQAWEYQPLGPFLGKSFATSVAAWVTPLEALAPCRVPGPEQDPPVLPYLTPAEPWGLDIDLAVDLQPTGADEAETVSRTSFAAMYWTFPQQVAHMTVNGAHLRTGDLFASGTVSGSTRGSEGSFVELTRGGAAPITVAGQERRFLEDGDEVTLRGSATVADGVTITLGEVRGRVVPSPG